MGALRHLLYNKKRTLHFLLSQTIEVPNFWQTTVKITWLFLCVHVCKLHRNVFVSILSPEIDCWHCHDCAMCLAIIQVPFYIVFYSLAKGYCHHVCIHLSVCLSVHPLIIPDCGQLYIPQPHFTCQIIDTSVLI